MTRTNASGTVQAGACYDAYGLNFNAPTSGDCFRYNARWGYGSGGGISGICVIAAGLGALSSGLGSILPYAIKTKKAIASAFLDADDPNFGWTPGDQKY